MDTGAFLYFVYIYRAKVLTTNIHRNTLFSKGVDIMAATFELHKDKAG
jgi:hypothetical protein